MIVQFRKNKWQIDNQDDKDKKEPEEKDLPELTDECIKSMGDFKDLGDFKIKIKENIHKEKEHKIKEKKRAALGEKLIEETKVSLPRILVESELEKMLAQFKNDVAALGMPFEKYLEKIKKTEEDLRTEWKTDAGKKATLQLALNNIATEENIVVPEEDVQKQTEHILKHHKDANPNNVRIYTTTLLTNQKVFEFLEKTAE